jgi:hypothetical protein
VRRSPRGHARLGARRVGRARQLLREHGSVSGRVVSREASATPTPGASAAPARTRGAASASAESSSRTNAYVARTRRSNGSWL